MPFLRKPDTDVVALVADLRRAEAALRAALSEDVDAVLHPPGHVYLLEQAQKALIEREDLAKNRAAWLEAILENAPDTIAYVGRDGIIVWLNQEGERTLRRGAHWLSHLPDDQRPPLERALAEAIERGEPITHEGRETYADGSPAWISRRFGPVRKDGEVVGAVLISRDLTAAKNAETQLVLAERMASLGMLAASVAHEINNPLASVVFNLDLIREELTPLVERGVELGEIVAELDDARLGATRVAGIARDLKVFARKSDDLREAVNVEAVLDATLRLAWNEIRHRAQLEKSYCGAPLVVADEARLGQVFLNLVMNAVQALPEGRAEEHVIGVRTFLTEPGHVSVAISDNGPGMPVDVQEQLFTPFFTTKPAGVGTGLGLSICRRLVTDLGGEIAFTSAVGRGTEFVVSLPRPAGPLDASPRVAPSPRPVSGRGRVLLVDDEPLIDRAIARALRSEHDITFVGAGRDVLALLEEGERFDVVLCDLMMPQMTGMDLYEAVRRIDGDQARRMAFVTGGAFTARARAFLELVPNARIEKPLSLDQLRGFLSALLQSSEA